MALQFRRGTDSDRLTITPAAGEPIFTSDTKELFIGDGSTTGGVDLITTKLGSISGDIVPDTDSAYDLGSPTKKFKDLHLSGNSIYLGAGLVLSNDGGIFAAKDSDNNPVVISLTSNNTGQLSEGTNLYYTTARADSAFDVRLATKTTANVTEGSNLYFTNARADARITNALLDEDNMASNSATKIPSQQSVKAYVDAEVAGIVDTAPAALNTLNELAAALGDDANFSTTITTSIGTKLTSAQTTALIDSAYVQARTTAGTDSAATISLIGTTVDSAYVQARQTSGGGGSSIDSAATIALIDSAYVQARQTSGGIDSAATTALVDSAYVQVRQVTPVSSFNTIAVSGQTNIIADSAGVTNYAATVQQAILQASNRGQDYFGQRVAIDNGYAIVNADNEDTGGSNAGSVYVYARSGSTWSQQQQITSPISPPDGHYFGTDLDIEGSRIVIGSKYDDTDYNQGGGVHVYTRSGTTWSLEQRLASTDIAANDWFGDRVAISGNYIVASAHKKNSSEGAVYVFKGATSTTLQGSSYDSVQSVSLNSIESQPKSMLFNSDGTKVFIVGMSADAIKEYSLATPYDISTNFLSNASSSYSLTISGENNMGVYTMRWNSDGTKVYVLCTNNMKIYQHNLTTAYDISTASYSNKNFSTTTQENAYAGFTFNNDGTSMYLCGSQNNKVFQYTLSTADDISTASYANKSFTPQGSHGGPIAIQFDESGKKLFILGNQLRQHDLATAFDVSSSISVSYSINILTNATQAGDFTFNADMSKLYAVEPGADKIFQFSTSGAATVWVQQAKLLASDKTSGDKFGFDVAIDGDTIAIGAAVADTGGKVYAFTRSGSTWSQQAAFTSSDVSSEDEFGGSVSISSNTILVGAYSSGGTSSAPHGAAYVFTRSGTTWSQQAKIQPSDTPNPSSATIAFAYRQLAIENDIAVIGHSSATLDGTANVGAAYIFERSGTTWSQVYKFGASDATASDAFGHGIDISGKDVIVGAPSENNGKGQAYTFVLPNAATYSDTLTLAAGSGITITTNAVTDTVTIAGSAAGNDSATTIALIDSAYVQARQTSGGIDSGLTTSLIDSSYVQARQTKYTNADFTDSAYVTSQINSVIDAAPGALNTLNELAAAMGDDANFSTTVTNSIATKLTSAQTTALVDSAYVQARVTASGNDSATTIALIDSAYVQARQTSSAGNDSATTIALIDSAYVQARETAQVIQIDSSLTTGDSSQIIDQFPIGTHRTTKYIAQLSSPAVTGYTNWPGMTQQQIILGNETGILDAMGTGDEFGRGMAIGENQLLVGATRNDRSTDNSGAVVYYTRDSANGTWSYTDFVQPSSPASSDFFGQSIAADSNFDTIAVTGHSEGLYIMDRASNDWRGGVQKSFLKANSFSLNDDEYGKAVSTSANGNYIAAGAQLRDTGGTNRGEVFVYFKDSADYSLQAAIQSDDIANGDKFGNCVALNDAGDTLVVGAWFKGGASNNGAPGAAYIFTRSGTTWTQKAKLTPSDHPGNNDVWYFGNGCDISNDGSSVIIGAPYAKVGSNSAQGAAYIFNDITEKYNLANSTLAQTSSALSQDSLPHALAFNSNGTKMYMAGDTNDRVYQYSLSTAYDLSTISYDNVSLDISSQVVNVWGMRWNNDGTKLFLVCRDRNDVVEYDLSTAYDISTASYNNVKFATDSQDTSPSGLFFKPDGTKMYLVGYQNDRVYQYSLSAAYDLSTVSYDNVSFDVSSEDNTPDEVEFTPDGTRMFILGDENNSIYQYTLSTAFDLSTASYDSVSFSGIVDGSPRQMVFDNDGSNYFVLGRGDDKVRKFQVAGWSQYVKLVANDGAASDAFSGDINGTGNSHAVAISGDGGYAIVGAPYDDDTASSAGTAYIFAKTGGNYDLSSPTYVGNENISNPFTNATDLAFNADGTKVYVCDYILNIVGQYSLSTPYLISSATYDSVSLNVNSYEEDIKALAFSTDGTKLFVAGSASNKIIRYNLSTAFDLSTASYHSQVSVSSQNTGIGSIRFKPDGSKLFVLDNGTDTVYSYSLSSAYDLSTLVYDNQYLNVNSQETVPNGMAVSTDGSKLFIVGQTADKVFQYTLRAGWTLSTASYLGANYSISGKETVPHGIEFHPDGTKMYVCGRTSDKIHEWNVTSPEWGQQQKIQASGLASSNNYGWSVTMDQDGNTAAVGAYRVQTNSTSYGRAYIYTRSGSSWLEEQSVIHSDYSTAGTNAYFGYDLDLDHTGNLLIVGAPDAKAASGINTAGSAYLFERKGTQWKELKKYIASNPTSGDDFGEAVAMGNDGLSFVAGANHEDTSLSNSGAAYVFVHPSQALELAEWSQSYKVIPSTTNSSNAFTQCDINAAGTIAITGAHYDAPGGTTEAGTAYIYSMDSADGVWKNSLEINASDKQANDHFGHATVISGSGGVAVVAASQEDSGGSNAGAVYVYNADNNYVMHTGVSGEYNNYTSTGNGRYQGIKGLSVAPLYATTPNGLDLHPDGYKFFVTTTSSQSRVHMWTMSKAWDMQTATWTNSFDDVDNQASAITGVKFSPDGTKMFITNNTAVAGGSEAAVFQYALGIAYDLTTVSYTGKSLTIGSSSKAQDVQFNNDGTKMFVLDDDNSDPTPNNGVREYTLSTAYDISTATFVTNFEVNSQDNIPSGLTFHPDGKKMYVSGSNYHKVFQYNLTTAFDVSTASYANASFNTVYSVNQSNNFKIRGHRWRPDGSQLFVTNDVNTNILTYYTGGLAYTEVKKLVQTGSNQMGLDGGLAISDDGGSIFVSSYYEGINGVNQQGAVYVFTGSGANWTMTQKLTGDVESSSQFGTSIAIDGDNLIIGAHGTNGISDTSLNCGAAYLFTKDADGVWTERKKIQHSDADGTNRFGSYNGVAIKGTDVGVGAWNMASGKGRAYVFTTSGIAGAFDASHHSEEILLMHDGTNVGLTSYGKLLLNDNLGTFNGDIVGNNAQLKLSPTRVTTTVKLSAIRNKI